MTLSRTLEAIVSSDAYVLVAEFPDYVLKEEDDIGNQYMKKYLLEPNSTYSLHTDLPTGNVSSALNEITFEVEKGKEDYLEIGDDGNVRTGEKTCDVLGIDIHVQYAEFLDVTIYVAIVESLEIIDKELSLVHTSLEQLEEEERDLVTLRYNHFGNEGSEALPDSFTEQFMLYTDSVMKYRYSWNGAWDVSRVILKLESSSRMSTTKIITKSLPRERSWKSERISTWKRPKPQQPSPMFLAMLD